MAAGTIESEGRAHARSKRLRGPWVTILKRLLIIPPTLFFITTVAFLLVEIMPGDPALVILGNGASEAELIRIRSELGLDLPMGERYVNYLGGLLRGDLGTSFFTGQPVLADILKFLPASIELVVLSLILAGIIGTTMGALSGYFRGRLPDRVTRVIITSLQAIPDFLIGLMLIFFIFYLWRLAPSPTGRLGIIDTYPPTVTGFLLVDLALAGDWKTFGTALHRSLLPVLTLALGSMAYFAKIARTTVGAAMWSRQVQFARACGLPEWRVLQYALLASRTSILTYTAILFGAMVGGSSIIETMFAWQGLGQWGLSSILALDIPAIQGFVIVTGLITMTVYLALDLLVVALDPRIQHD